jgi:ribonucleoside-diphosphate reductase alpha chain
MATLDELKKQNEAPEWMQEEGYKTLSNGYLVPGETPKQMYRRVASAAAKYYKNSKENWENKFFDVMWKNWLGLASPVCSNMGTDRGLPISCNSLHVGDSIDSIFDKNHELAILSKNGAGVGIYMGDVRGRGAAIKGNGVSEGIVPWAKCFDTTTMSVNQGATRRGASAVYLPVEHLDVDEFINIRRPVGDMNRRCLNIHHAVCIGDEFMNKVENKDKSVRETWEKILSARVETGEPYLFFTDNVNRQNPKCYNDLNLKVSTSNICNEIYLYTDPDHTFVCCLSSLNLLRWDEWKNSDLVRTAVYFLDAVMEEYIQKAQNMRGFESAVRFAKKSRALGVGVLGWHSLLQSKNIPFDSFDAMTLNAKIFKHMREMSDKTTLELGKIYGEPEWCNGSGRRNSHCLAIAPTVSNALISGGVSQGIEPIISNVYAQKSAKGTFIRKNPELKKLLEAKGKDTIEIWNKINSNMGSVSGLDFLTREEKDVFMTAKEINQFAIINQAAQRQKWIDQGQSVNLFFGTNSDPKYIHEVHMEAWRKGMKGLYYCRTESVLRTDSVFRSKDDCRACEG